MSRPAALRLDGLGDVAFRTGRLGELLEVGLGQRTGGERHWARAVARADRQLGLLLLFGGEEHGRQLDETRIALGTVEVWRAGAAGAERRTRRRREIKVSSNRDQGGGDISQSTEALRRSTDVADLATSRESTNAALQGVLEQWLALGVGKALLEECLARYRRDRQPKVVNYASELFREITDGRYSRLAVVGDDKDASIAALDASGQVVDATSLSTGAQGAALLDAPAGLRRHLRRRGRHAADRRRRRDRDHADDRRELTVATILARVSEHHQVIAFTCHQSLVDALVEAAPDARVIQLA